MSPDQVFAIVIGSIAAWTIARVFRGPLGEAIARRIGGAGQPRTDHDDQQLADLQGRLASSRSGSTSPSAYYCRNARPGSSDRGMRDEPDAGGATSTAAGT